jgi:hypothetical protein
LAATRYQYSSVSMREGGMDVLRPYSRAMRSEPSPRISSSFAKRCFCAWARTLIIQIDQVTRHSKKEFFSDNSQLMNKLIMLL